MDARKILRIAVRVLLAFVVLVIVVLALGDFAVDRYINADNGKNISKYLPINATVTYENASFHPFRDFPDLSLKMQGIQVADSLTEEHGHPPLTLEKLNVRVSMVDWSQKQIAIQSIDLEGLTLNVFDGANGYSNIANLVRKKVAKATNRNKKAGVSVVSSTGTVNINGIELTKIDQQSGQRVLASIDQIAIENSTNDSHALSLKISTVKISDLPQNPTAQHPIELARAVAKVKLDQSFSKLTLQEIQLGDGRIHLYSDSLGFSNYANLFGARKEGSIQQASAGGSMSVDMHGAHVLLNDIDFSLIDHPKNKHLAAHIIRVETEIQAPIDFTTKATALVDLQLDVEQLAFNTKKGAYLSESLVHGQIETTITPDRIRLTCPALKINEEPFSITANMYTDQKVPRELIIEKQDARISNIRPLLTSSIQKSISQYDVRGELFTEAHIYFTPGKKDPRVEVDFKVANKTVTAKGHTIKKANVSATFVNRLYDDARQFGEDKRNVRFMIHDVRGELNELQIESQNALITSTPDRGDRIVAKAEITGAAASISRYLKHDNFHFEDGKFALSTDINGSLNNLDDLVAGTDLDLAMEDLEVHYPAGDAMIPLRFLELKKQGEKTIFEIEGYTESYQRPFRIRGEVDRVASLLFPGNADRLHTEANIRATSISWEGVVALFGKDGLFSGTEKQAKRSMKQTLSGIQQSFQPIVRIAIDTVFYGEDLQLLDFQSGVKFDDKRTLVLEETSFKLEEANVTLEGAVEINELDLTRFDFDIELKHLDFDALMPKFDYFGVHLIRRIHDQPDDMSMKVKLSGELDDNAGLRPESINADITYESFAEDKFSGRLRLKANPATKRVEVIFGHSGHPRNFNHILETDAYRFDKGWYSISFQFDDNFETIAQMVEESTFSLTIDDAEVYLTEVDVMVPLTRIEVASIRNKAYYHLLLQSDSLDQSLAFDGIVNNIRHLTFKDSDKPYDIELEISSDRIVWDQLKQIIAYGRQDASKAESGKALKESLTKVLTDFNPNVTLKLDELTYSDKLQFKDIYAHAYLVDSILKVDSATVSYGESQIQANLSADMAHDNILPFHMQLKLSDIDISQTLEHFDYFNISALREAKQIDGDVWLDLDMQAEMNLAKEGFNNEQTIASIGVRLENLDIEDLQLIDTITTGIRMKQRFKALRFAPIETQLKVLGQRLEVTRTELRANAIQAFVEGAVDKKSSENLWISIPVYNIKSPDLDADLEKTGYEAAGRKVYLSLISSEDEDDGKLKFHLRKKKYFQERLKPKQFRAYKRIRRRARRTLRTN